MPTSPQVDAYIRKAAPYAQPILRHLRALVHRGCPMVTESIKWSMPSFTHAGKILCHMAAFKAHCAFGFWHREMREVLGTDGARQADAMGNLGRITSVSDLPEDKAMIRYVQTAAKLNESTAPARPRVAAKPKSEPEVPDDLTVALKKNQRASATFAKFSPSHRREYIEWISEAKRDETRQKRLATTLEWLAAGKSRNWKYETC